MKIDHIGIAVKSLEEAKGLYTKVLGLEWEQDEEVHTEAVRVSFLKTGESHIELLEALSDDSAIARFIDKKGEGIHHLAFAVDDIGAALEKARVEGYQLIDESPRRGAGGKLVAFLHPKSTNGVLIELCQKG